MPERYRGARDAECDLWKTMLFAGRGVEFTGANYSASGLVYQSPYVNFEDEAVGVCWS